MKKLQKLMRSIRIAYHKVAAKANQRAALQARRTGFRAFSKATSPAERNYALSAWYAAAELEDLARDHLNRAEFLNRG